MQLSRRNWLQNPWCNLVTYSPGQRISCCHEILSFCVFSTKFQRWTLPRSHSTLPHLPNLRFWGRWSILPSTHSYPDGFSNEVPKQFLCVHCSFHECDNLLSSFYSKLFNCRISITREVFRMKEWGERGRLICRLPEPSETKIWQWVQWDSKPRIISRKLAVSHCEDAR
jgi:hypothetical protein